MGFNYRIDCNSRTSFFINDDIIEAYFNEVRHYPLLSETEEYELAKKIKNAPTEKERENAKTKLIQSNLRFVVSVAKKLGTPDTLADLISEGNIGLIKAIEKFDADKDYHLITYALSWIVAYIKNYQITQMNSVVPPNALKLHNYVKNVTREFYVKNERNPTPHEIADMVRKKFNFKITNLEDVELGRMISIDEKYGVIDEDETVEDSNMYLQRSSTNNINDDIDEQYTKHKLDFFLGKLDKRERFIVERHFGIGCLQESFDTIGLRLQPELGGERVRQICNNAVKKMQKYKKMVKD
jgi:RNA polymerase primary sigma factor